MESSTRDEELERRHLAHTLEVLRLARARAVTTIEASAKTIDEQKRFVWANQRDMDHAEKASIRTEVDISVTLAEGSAQAQRRLERLLDSPYFGRVDFAYRGEGEAAAHYIGIHGFREPDARQLLVHDWRAPVSSLYYDFELGEASFDAPEGTAHGEITGKRQYKIQHGELEFMIESALTIGDDILQRELSHSADDKMKNIVATIQREQNAVIRNETASVLILQGVAGSGKTSIALHRIAFLLYRFKDTLSSDNVMILSPNKVFGDYISNVLPELGEERVSEIDFDAIASRFLAKVTGYQTFSEQVTTLLDGADDAAAERMRYKAAPDFVSALDEWMSRCESEAFTPSEIEVRRVALPASWAAQNFAERRGTPLFTRLDRIADAAVYQLKHRMPRGTKWTAADTASVRKQVRAMFPYADPFALYKAFYDEPGREGLFVPLGRKKLEHTDAFPLIYTILKTTQQERYDDIRHLLVDEMQDYTPVQYAVLRHLFACKMTILGDANQSVNPFSSSSLETIHGVFPEAACLELLKSYRSTTEITAFSQNISRNDRLIPVDRAGLPPRILACEDAGDEVSRIATLVEQFRESSFSSLGILCKTLPQARALSKALEAEGCELTLLDYGSTSFSQGAVVTSAHISKGLEFDTVIVPHVDRFNYADDLARGMLYISCTRALHELHLTHHGEPSRLLDFARVDARAAGQ